MTSKQSMISSFIEDAPPGELTEVVNDINTLTSDDASLQSQTSAFKKYNEEQFTTTKLSGADEEVIVSPYNQLEGTRYFDVETQTSFDFDHITRKATNSQPYTLDSKHGHLIKPLLQSVQKQAAEHFPSFSAGVYPTDSDSKIAIVLVANKYSPQNFWNGRWRSQYLFDPASSSLNGSIKVDVHYYEDGNVRLLTEKPVSASVGGGSASDIAREIAKAEKRYQEDLNRAFTNLSEGVFKSLRRQLPVTRQKIEWEKIGGYRLGQDIGGGRSR